MFDKIVLGVDGSESSSRAADAAKELASKLAADVVVVHVRERAFVRGGAVDLETSEEAVALLDETVRALKDAGVSARGEMRRGIQGHAAKEITDVAEAEDAGLIILGSRGLSDFSGLLLGSVTHKALHTTQRPVLVVR